MSKIKIDGKELEFEEGMTILDVAEKANIYIPTLCFIKGLTAHGGCRLCIVKVKGDPKPIQTACSTVARPGMDIITKDEELNSMRKDIVQLLLSEHPSGCLVCGHKPVCDDYQSYPEEIPSLRVFGCFSCPSKDICQLKKIVEYLDLKELQFPMKYRHMKPTSQDLFFQTDLNLCITCGKCVRICSELYGYNAIELIGRGKNSVVGFPEKGTRNQSECQFCGGCMDNCPVGVYNTKKSRWYKDYKEIKESICGFCSLGCGFQYQIFENNIIEAIPNIHSPVNKGTACVLGRFCMPEFHHASKRLKSWSIKNGNEKQTVPAEVAIRKISETLIKYTLEEIAVLVSPDITNESAFLLKKFADQILKTQNIGIITQSNAIDFIKGERNLSRNLSKIPEAKWILLLDANVQISHPVLFPLLKKAKDKGALLKYYSSTEQKVPLQTQYLLNEENYWSAEKINEVLSEHQQSNGIIIIGPSCDNSIATNAIKIALNNENVDLFPLKFGANFEGVYSIIGIDDTEILEKLKAGKIKALYLTERISLEYAKKAEFIVLQDIFQSELSDLVDVVVPTCSFLEQSGTFTNLELRTQTFQKIIDPPSNQCLSDWEVICKIAQAIKPELKSEFNYRNIEEIKIQRMIDNTNSKPKSELKSIPTTNRKEQVMAKLSNMKYRGQAIHQLVPDLQKLIEIRENNQGIQQTNDKFSNIIQNQSKKDNVLQIELCKEGFLKIGNEKIGLTGLNGIVTIASSRNMDIELIIDQQRSNLVLLKAEEFCLCNNYRNNLNKSKILLDLTQDLYKHIIRTKVKLISNDGVEYLQEIPNPIIMDPKFARLSEQQLQNLKPINIDEEMKQDVGMQFRAMNLTHFLLKNRKLLQVNLTTSQIKQAAILQWKMFSTKPKFTTSTFSSPIKSEQTLLNSKQGKIVQSDPKKCMGCGKCAEICPHDAITMITRSEQRGPFENIIVRYSSINPNICYRCARCIHECPVFAISIFDFENQK